MVRNYVNLSNGIEALPSLPPETIRFMRLRSTDCEHGRWEAILMGLPDEFLLDLAAGHQVVVHDRSCSNRKSGLSRAQWQGIDWVRFALSMSGWGQVGPTEGVLDGRWRLKWAVMRPEPRGRLRYYSKFVRTDKIILECAGGLAEHDGDSEWQRKTWREWVEWHQSHKSLAQQPKKEPPPSTPAPGGLWQCRACGRGFTCLQASVCPACGVENPARTHNEPPPKLWDGQLRCHCGVPATHAEHWYHGFRLWCDKCVPMSGHGEYCGQVCSAFLRALKQRAAEYVGGVVTAPLRERQHEFAPDPDPMITHDPTVQRAMDGHAVVGPPTWECAECHFGYHSTPHGNCPACGSNWVFTHCRNQQPQVWRCSGCDLTSTGLRPEKCPRCLNMIFHPLPAATKYSPVGRRCTKCNSFTQGGRWTTCPSCGTWGQWRDE